MPYDVRMNKYQMWLQVEGLTDREIAEALAIDPSYAWMIRNGRKPISDSFKWRFAEVYGFALAAKLFGDTVASED